jgi:5-methylcytosine-specific restriction endonuclease McrA
LLDELKKRPCADCGKVFPPCVYEFHHVVPRRKRRGGGIGSMESKSTDVFLAELKKCVMLCANCHKIRHEQLRVAEEQASGVVEEAQTRLFEGG